MVSGGLTYVVYLLSYLGRGHGLGQWLVGIAAVAVGAGASLLWTAEGVSMGPWHAI